MKTRFALALLAFALSTAPLGAFAQTVAPVIDKVALKDAAEGEVRKVDKEAKKITLKHGPIKNLDMPGMTMVFQVKDAALLDKLAAGDKIIFTAEQDKGAMVVTGIEKVAPK